MESRPHLCGGLKPILRRLPQRAHDHGLYRLWDLEVPSERRWRVADMLQCNIDRRLAVEWRAAGKHLVEDNPQAVEITRSRSGLAAGLLR